MMTKKYPQKALKISLEMLKLAIKSAHPFKSTNHFFKREFFSVGVSFAGRQEKYILLSK